MVAESILPELPENKEVEMTQERFNLCQKAIDIVEQLDIAKIELKKLTSIAHQERKFAKTEVYAKLQTRVAQLKAEHQRILLDIHMLKEKEENESTPKQTT